MVLYHKTSSGHANQQHEMPRRPSASHGVQITSSPITLYDDVQVALQLGVFEHIVESHLVVLVTRHYHETDVRRRKRALEQRNAFTTRQSHASLVRRFADGTHSNTFVVENHAHLVGGKHITVQRSKTVAHHAANIKTRTGFPNKRGSESPTTQRHSIFSTAERRTKNKKDALFSLHCT